MRIFRNLGQALRGLLINRSNTLLMTIGVMIGISSLTVIVAIGFGLGDKIDLIQNKKPFSAVYTIDENHWNGNISLQLKLKDIKA